MSWLAKDAARSADAVAADHLPTCPTCGDLCPPDATRCECGERLHPRAYELPRRVPHGCTCGGNDTCTHCVIEHYDNGVGL